MLTLKRAICFIDTKHGVHLAFRLFEFYEIWGEHLTTHRQFSFRQSLPTNKQINVFFLKLHTHGSCNNLFTESDRRSEHQPCPMNEMLFLYTSTTSKAAFNGTLNPISVSKTHRRCKRTRSPNAFSRKLACGIFCVSRRCIGTCQLETTKYRRCSFSFLFFFSIIVSFGRLLACVENAVFCCRSQSEVMT